MDPNQVYDETFATSVGFFSHHVSTTSLPVYGSTKDVKICFLGYVGFRKKTKVAPFCRWGPLG